MAVKNINDQPVKTPTYLWGVDEVGLACRATPYVSPVLSVVGLTGEITQSGLRAALGLGTAAYINVASTGNASAAEIVKGNDTRLSDARTPVAHTHAAANISDSTVTGRAVLTATDQTAARTAIGAGTSSTYNVAVSGNAAPGEVVKGDDTRLTDARNPTSHSHVAADVTNLGTAATEDVGVANGVAPLGADAKVPSEYLPAASGFDGDYNSLTNKPTLGTAAPLNAPASGDAAAGEVVKGNDSRLVNARTPTAHNQAASTISDSTPVGRSVLTATDAATARSAIGAAPTDSPTFTTNISTPAVNGAALGPKNRLVNGCMRIPSPNGASGAAALGENHVGAAGVTTSVGGFATFSGAIYQVGGVQDSRTSSGAMHYLVFGATTGGSGQVVYKLQISAEDALTMAGKSITVSCRLMAAGTTPTTSWLRRYKASGYNDFSTTVFLGDGAKSNTSAMSVPLDLEYTFTPTYADCVNGMQIEVVGEYTGANGSPQSPSYFSVADFQVIEGSKRLPFEARHLYLERALVNRFKPTAPSNLTANTTLASNAKYSYSAGALTLTLPAAPANGDEVVIYNTGSLLTTVVGRNGKTIMGLAQDMTLDIANKKYVFEYLSATGDWRIGA